MVVTYLPMASHSEAESAAGSVADRARRRVRRVRRARARRRVAPRSSPPRQASRSPTCSGSSARRSSSSSPSSARCFRENARGVPAQAAEGKRGDDALHAMGTVLSRTAPATTDTRCARRCRRTPHAAIRRSRPSSETATATSSRYVERVAGDLPPEEISRFFATGMLLNVIASMGLARAERAVGCRLARRAAEMTGLSFFTIEVSD